MKRIALILAAAVMAVVVISACQTETEKTYETRWAGETMEEILANIESQFGGFSQAMMEVNYRYNELYWAGVDENWGYAEYQLDKLLDATLKGFVRRPDREPSAAQFVNTSTPRLLEAIEEADRAAFLERFDRYADSCNTCHEMEDVPFVRVIVPEKRTTLIKF